MNRVVLSVIVILGMLSGIGYMFYSLSSEISDLKDEVSILKSNKTKLTLAKKECLASRGLLELSLDEQNQAIDKLAMDMGKANEELVIWKNKKEEVKYEYITKTIYKDRDIFLEPTEEKCMKILKVIENVKEITYDKL